MFRPHFRVAIVALTFATTALSQTTWTSFEDRKGHAIASDPNGGVMMFGGESVKTSDKLLNDTQQLSSNNKKWTAANTLLLPLPRTEHALAAGTDANLDRVFVMYGGRREASAGSPSTIVTDDTFVFVGGDWVKIDPPVGTNAPPARTGHAMVTDLFRNKVVLFGGFGGGIPRNDLWEFDPATNEWTEVIANFQPGSPTPRFDHTMAFHAVTGRIYLFGGSGFKDDTWYYEPGTQTWTNFTQATKPPGRTKSALSYMPLFDNMVLFGGQDNTLTPQLDTWTLDPYSGAWTQQFPTTSPPARFEHAVAPDQAGQKAVLLGGTDGSAEALESTWLWTGANWVEEIPPPSPRTGVAMAYDSARGKHVLFGGRSEPGGVDLGDTWELEELTWSNPTPSPTPGPRADAGLSFDSNRNVTVLFGGRQGGACGTPLGDTWEWDGTTWSLRNPALSPPSAGGVQPVFDSSRNLTWMLVGSDMWSYDGTTWSVADLPTSRGIFASAYDTARNTLVLFGGTEYANFLNETWEWSNGAWQRRTPLTSPAGRHTVNMAYDASIAACVMYGGRHSGGNYNDTWTWDGMNWTPHSSGALSARRGSVLGYDPDRAAIALFGGHNGGSPFNGTYDRVGNTWSQSTTNTTPPARERSVMSWDPVRQRILMFGGRPTGTGYVGLSDTWEYDGIDWHLRSPANSPSPRLDAMMVHDSHTGKTLLFGGINNSNPGNFLGDTWEWDGNNWQQLAPTTNPTGRYGGVLFSTGTRTLLWGGFESDQGDGVPGSGVAVKPEMWEWNGNEWTVIDSGTPSSRTNYGAAYDARRDRVVVFGGRSQCGSGSYLGETWEWDGASWLQRFPINAPSPRERCRLAYDTFRSRVVLYGGTDGSNTFADTWEWDGDNWIQRSPTSVPGASSGHAMSYDAGRRLSILFGTPGTWDYGSERPGETISTDTVATCLSILGTTPQLVPTEWNGPWVGDSIGLDFLDMPPSIPVLLIGFTPLPLPLNLFFLGQPLCELAVSPDIIEPLFPFVPPYESGPLPNDPALEGVSLYAQAAFLDLFGGPLVTSNSLQLTLGSK